MKNNQSITTIYGGIMGTFLKVTQYGKPHKKVADKVSDYFQKIEHVCSRFLENSEISCINRNAGVGPVSVSPLCEEICLEAWKETKFTEGAFNLTIGVLSSLWNIGQDNAGFPGEEAIKAATKLVDIEALEIKNHSVFLKKKGMSIDLGGIAKEFALFQSACLAEEKYHEGMLIDAGGDIATVGNKSDGSPWCIGIQHPRKRNTLLATIMLDNWDMIQTSGDYRRFIKHKDTFYSHIFLFLYFLILHFFYHIRDKKSILNKVLFLTPLFSKKYEIPDLFQQFEYSYLFLINYIQSRQNHFYYLQNFQPVLLKTFLLKNNTVLYEICIYSIFHSVLIHILNNSPCFCNHLVFLQDTRNNCLKFHFYFYIFLKFL